MGFILYVTEYVGTNIGEGDHVLFDNNNFGTSQTRNIWT